MAATCTSLQSPPRAVLTPRAASARAMPRMVVTPLACISLMMGRTLAANASAIWLRALMEARRAASRSGAFLGLTSEGRSKFDQLALRPNQRKFTHYQGYHRQRLAFFGSAFCTPTSCPQGCRHVLRPRRSSEVLAADPGARLS